jgi:hypothetical protein
MQLVIEEALRGLIQDYQAGRFSIEGQAGAGRATKAGIRQILISCLLSSG